MTTPSAQSNLALAPAVGFLVRRMDWSIAEAVEALVAAGFHAVQLDFTLPGIRPRELSRRGRQDLSATIRRRDAVVCGADFFIPRRHYLDTAHTDRAMLATLQAIELAADLGRIPLSVALPIREMAADLKEAIVSAAEVRDVRLAVHAEDQLEDLETWLRELDQPMIGAGLDPVPLLMRQVQPAQVVHRLAPWLFRPRLADVTSGPAPKRCRPGQGELDLLTYRIALELAQGRTGPVVLDLAELEDPLAAARVIRETWESLAAGR